MKKILIILVPILTFSNISTCGQDKWTDLSYDHVTAYFVRQPLVDEEIIEDGKLNSNLESPLFTVLSPRHIKKLNRILTKEDRPGGYAIMECFLPRHGVVFWDENERPIAWVSVCFECNQIKAIPELNKNDLKDFKTLFKNLGFPIHDRGEDY
jgi:hypothetical protein